MMRTNLSKYLRESGPDRAALRSSPGKEFHRRFRGILHLGAMMGALMGAASSATAAVDDVSSISALRSYGGTATTVYVQGHGSAGDGGGGEFVRNGVAHLGGTTLQCGPTTSPPPDFADDDGVVIIDNSSAKNCWYRQFTGPAHLAWYGVPDAANGTASNGDPCNKNDGDFQLCAADKVARTDTGTHDAISAAFSAAAQSAGLGGDGGVVTDGRSIVTYYGDLEIPPTQYLSCAGPAGGGRAQLTKTGANQVAYYSLPNSIVLKAGFSIVRDANTLLKSCIVRPTWYSSDTVTSLTTSATPTRTLIDNVEHSFAGAATMCGTGTDGTDQDGEACNMDDVLIVGFDVCDDTRAAAHAVLSNLKYECNVGEFVHNNGGGLTLASASVENFIEATMNVGTTDITRFEPAITSITQNGSEVQITVDPAGNEIADGDTVLISGIPNGSGPVGQNARWIVECGGASPCASGIFNLKNSSWTGPSYTSASWIAGSNVVSVNDTSNVAGGQYLCASGTGPFCSAPTDFAAATTTTSTVISNTMTKPLLTVVSTAKWPSTGLVCIYATGSSCGAGGSSTEYMGYTLVDATHIQITLRNADDSAGSHTPGTGIAHSSGATLEPSAPGVIAPVPSVNKVIVNAAAAHTGGTGVTFSNDPFTPDSTTNTFCSTTCGYAILNANYRTWTGLEAAGTTPEGRLTTTATGSTAVLTVPGNIFKLQPGMQILDLTPGHDGYLKDVNGNPFIVNSVSVSGGTVTISHAPNTALSGDSVQFTGCGYPNFGTSSAQPWLGNCTATAYLLYGDSSTKGAVGTGCDYLQAHAWRTYMHMNNGQETVCNKMIFDSGTSQNSSADDSDQADPTSTGIWVEGDGNKIELSQGKVNARTGFLNASTHQPDALGLTNFNFANDTPNSIIFANTGSATLGELKGSADGIGYADSSGENLTLTGNEIPGIALYTDDPSALSTVHCANNTFATDLCGNLLTHIAAGGVPLGVSSGSVTGNDGAGRIVLPTIPGGGTVVLTFAAPWASTPVCFAQDETSTTKNPVTAISGSPTSVTFKTNASTGFAGNDNISYQCTGFK